MSNKVVKRGVALYIDGREVENSVTSINREIRKLTSEWKKMDENTQAYHDHAKKIRSLKSILAEHNQQLKNINQNQSFSLSKGVDLFNKYAASAAAVIAALTGVILKLNSLRKLANEREEAKANVQALTGLDDKAITWLEDKAVELSTKMDESGLRIRQSASEILEAYMTVGSNKPELLEVKEDLNAVTVEAMRLSAASGMALPKAVDATTTALNQYGASADEAAKYVNVLAAGSKFGAANVEQQTAAILKAGTIAASSNISIEELVGTIEMLGEKGLKNEVAGTGLKKFFTVLSTGATDTNPKVVGLTTAMENLNKKVEAAEAKAKGSGGAKLLKNMFGEEGLNTAMILTQNTEKVEAYTKAVTDTSIATEQAAINSDTAAAKLAQIRNELNETGVKLMKELNPAIMSLLNKMTNFSRHSVTVVKFITEHRSTLGLLTAAVILYTTWVNRKIVLDKLQVFWNNSVTTSFKNITKAIKANPWGLLLVAITTVIGALVDYRREQQKISMTEESLHKINKKTNEDYNEQASRIELLNKIIHNNNFSLDLRRKKLEELKSIIPGYNAQLTEEGNLIEDNTDAIKDYLTQLEKQIKMKAAEEELEELYKKQRLAQKKLLKEEQNEKSAAVSLSGAQFVANKQSSSLSTSGTKALNAGLNQSVLQMQTLHDTAKRTVQETKKELDELADAINAVNKEIGASASEMQVETKPNPETPIENENDEPDNNKKKRTNKELLQIEQKYNAMRLQLKEQYLKDTAMTEEDFNNLSTDLIYQELNDKLKILELEPEKRAEIQNKIMDLKIQFEKKLRQAEADEIQKAQDEKLRLEKEYLQKEQKAREEARANDARYESNINRKILLAKKQFFSELVEKAFDSGKKQADASKESTDKQMSFMDILKASSIEGLGEITDAFGDFFESGLKDFGAFSQQVLSIILDTVEKAILAYYAEILAAEFAKKSFAGMASAAGMMALVTAAFETAKAVIGGNFYTGGYTGPGEWDEPKGYVHSNEFVANRFAVANPHVRPVLDLIDQAQRSNSIGNLSGEDIASVAGTASTVTVKQTPTVVEVKNDTDNKELNHTMTDLKLVIKMLRGRLDEPFFTINTISGRNGNKAQIDKYERMLNNKSRLKK